MRQILIAGVLSFIVFSFSPLAAQDTSAYRYILNYDVPLSPGLTAIGASQASVQWGSAAKPVVVHILSDLLQGSTAFGPGIAIDFSPYTLFGGRFKSVNNYRESTLLRMLANTQLSFATTSNSLDTSSLNVGIGARLVLWDDHDLLQNKQLGQDVDKALSSGAPPPPNGGTDGEATVVDAPDLTAAYANARQRVADTKGSSMAIGYGFGAILKGSSLSSDSIFDERHTVWVGGTYWFGKGLNGNLMYQGRFSDTGKPSNVIGISLRTTVPSSVSFAAELVYEFEGDQKLRGGVNAEFPAVQNINVTASLMLEPKAGSDALRLKPQVGLLWNMSE
ncbi:MAG: hypothetical protein KDD67_14560 [Ignavibacteriae bacterium]|nr:hypothetical protein [Ignavibacteriota bacterium]MCB9215169.1 hypothetical protein [Ignavibacteria bacterium]